jgi:hypothetical protein
VIKPKNGLRPKNRGKQKQNRSALRPRSAFAGVCVGSFFFPQPPWGFALQLRRPGGEIEVRGVGVGGERATATRTCFCVARAVLFFACVRPPPPKNRKTDRSKKPKKTFYIAYRPAIVPAIPITAYSLQPGANKIRGAAIKNQLNSH